jgi:hypothetical protein
MEGRKISLPQCRDLDSFSAYYYGLHVVVMAEMATVVVNG